MLIACSTGCETRLGNTTKEPPAPSPSNTYALTEKQLDALQTAGHHGDVGSMNRLALYYLVYDENEEKGLYWMERAADAGDLNAQKYLLGHYAEHQNAEKNRYGETLRERWKQR